MVHPTQPSRLWGYVGPSLLFLVWVSISYMRLAPTSLLPTPTGVVSAFMYLMDHGLPEAALQSSIRMIVGFLTSVALGYPMGVLCAVNPRFGLSLKPLLSTFRMAPIASVIPLTILWFGIEESQKVAVLVLGTVSFVTTSTISSIEAVEPTYLSLADTLGASGFQRVWKILIPASAPSVWESCRNLFGVVFSYLLVAETVSTECGLGALTISAQRRQQTDKVFALLFVILFLGWVYDLALKKLGKILFPWSEGV